ncbi:hypothetical protein QQF64_014331 [Cirrhinus molitorella]|uniref:Uncharacterized protein n=1 Tax=Cirrhinus molitorella TaxID=172907 RepID=A0ABR3NRT3_9TELE
MSRRKQAKPRALKVTVEDNVLEEQQSHRQFAGLTAAVSSNQVMSESSGSAASFVSCKGQLSCVFILKLIWMMVPHEQLWEKKTSGAAPDVTEPTEAKCRSVYEFTYIMQRAVKSSNVPLLIRLTAVHINDGVSRGFSGKRIVKVQTLQLLG